MATKRAAPAPIDLESVVPAIEARLRVARSIKTTELTKLGVPKPQHSDVLSRLVESGFELTKTGIRIKLISQLLAVVAERQQVPAKGLEKQLAGTTGPEVKNLANQLVQAGQLRRLLRGKIEWLAKADTPTLTLEELKLVQRVAQSLAATSKKLLANQKTRLALWRQDLDSYFAEIDSIRGFARVAGEAGEPPRTAADAPPAGMPNSSASQHAIDAAGARVLAALQAALDPSLQLAYVPTAVAGCSLSVHEAQQSLLSLARDGRIELRADSGQGRFSAEDLALAPEGPDDSRLLWARLGDPRT